MFASPFEFFLAGTNARQPPWEAGELDFNVAFPDQGEGSANEAIRALIDDGCQGRAMKDHRGGDKLYHLAHC